MYEETGAVYTTRIGTLPHPSLTRSDPIMEQEHRLTIKEDPTGNPVWLKNRVSSHPDSATGRTLVFQPPRVPREELRRSVQTLSQHIRDLRGCQLLFSSFEEASVALAERSLVVFLCTRTMQCALLSSSRNINLRLTLTANMVISVRDGTNALPWLSANVSGAWEFWGLPRISS